MDDTSITLPIGWENCSLENLLDYIQPTGYIVDSTDYNDNYHTPVLTAGKTFILGRTNEKHGIFTDIPVIIIDDFTTATKYVNFSFKVKSSAMKILKPSSSMVNLKYCFYYMQTIHIRAETHKRYWISEYSKLLIRLPPLAEQERIIAKIEELFSCLDKGIDNLKTAQKQLKIYRQALLKQAFEGKLTNKNVKDGELPEGWEEVKIGDAISILTDYHANGSYKSLKEKVELKDSKDYAAMIRSTNFEKNSFETDMKYISQDAYTFLSKSKLFGGEILIGKIGNAGRIYLMPIFKFPCSLAMNMFLLRTSEKVKNKYLYYQLCSEKCKQQIGKLIKGVGTPTIDKKSVRSIEIMLPKFIEEQGSIVSAIESHLSVCDKLEEGIAQSLQQAEALRQSILKRAFEGKLVHQDTSDEPASILLERIRSEREGKGEIKTAVKQRTRKSKGMK